MRLLSILPAILVVCALYLVLLQRPALLTFAYGEGCSPVATGCCSACTVIAAPISKVVCCFLNCSAMI